MGSVVEGCFLQWVAFGSDSKSLPETLTSKAGRGSGESGVVRVDRTESDTKKKSQLRGIKKFY